MDAKPDAAAARRHGQIIWRDPRDLAGYEKNSRTHSDAQIRQVRASIDEFGFTNPCLLKADEKTIGAGHARQLAALLDPALDEVPTITLSGLSDKQWRAYVITDNRLALNAGWNEEMLAGEIKLLDDDGFDLSLLGFDMSELSLLLNPIGEGLTDPDAVPEPPARPVTSLGDVWILGKHRIICGDCTDADVVAKLLAGASVDAAWTEPPYNVNYESAAGKIANDHMKDGDFAAFLLHAFAAAFTALKPGAAIYVAHADTEGLAFRASFKSAGFKLSGCLIWCKNSLVLGRSDYQWRHEPILYGWKPGAAHRWFGGRKNTTVIEMDRPKASVDHPTMKPVGLIEHMLKNSTQAGDIVLDLFGGSGSTAIACEQLGLQARLVELDPRYCDVIVRRWCEFTGQDATLEASGETFDSRRAARNAEIETGL